MMFMSSAMAFIIRDAETEDFFKSSNAPLLKAMGEKGKDIQLYLVKDSTFNAHVSGGKNVFYMSGLIIKVQNLEQFLAVSAHELAHISNNDLDNLGQALKKANAIQMSSLVLGVLGGVLSKNADVSAGTLGLGGTLSTRGLLADIRTNEIAADITGFNMLEKAKINSKGQIDVAKIMLDKSGYSSTESIYESTHPASEERLEFAQKRWEKSAYKDAVLPQSQQQLFYRIQAKLFGYVSAEDKVLQKYPLTDTSDTARYARAMFYLANNKSILAVEEMKRLVEKYPQDAYYWESYSHVLFDSGKITEAIDAIKKALKLYPKAGLMWIQYAQYLITKGGQNNLKEAEYALFKAKVSESKEALLYRMFTSLYSQTGEEGKRLLARAEEALLYDKGKAARIAKQAQKKLKKGTPEYISAGDIINIM